MDTSNTLKSKMQRFSSGSTPCGILSLGAVATQMRQWTKPKKRPKVGTGFHEKAQTWREEFLLNRHRALAESLRAYTDFSSTRRAEPWDTRFKPFDRVEKDGVYIIAKHLMEDKLMLCNYHQRAVKRLFCNVGLMGPQVTTQARWKPRQFAMLPANTTKQQRRYQKSPASCDGYND